MPEDKSAFHQHTGKSSEKFLQKERILAAVPISAGEMILDAGCGNGYMSVAFAVRTGSTGKVYAMDIDPAAVATVRTVSSFVQLEAFVGDITAETPLARTSIDLMYLSTVFHGFSAAQIRGFVAETRRLLKPNGRLAVVEIKKQDTPFGPPQSIRWSPEQLRQAVPLSATATVDLNEYFYLQLFENR